MSVSLEQPMREAEIDLVKLVNANEAAIVQLNQDLEDYFPVATTNIADGAVTQDKLAASSVGSNEIQDEAVTNNKLANNAVNSNNVVDGSIQATDLSNDVQAQLALLQSVPALEFGTSNSVTVGANSYTVVDITFGSTKTENPVVFPAIQSATVGAKLIGTVQSVTNAQCSICVTNLGTTNVSDVTVDYLAISER